jgi:hypothetical protein
LSEISKPKLKAINQLMAGGEGMTPEKAYLSAFPCAKKWRDKTLSKRALELFSDPAIVKYMGDIAKDPNKALIKEKQPTRKEVVPSKKASPPTKEGPVKKRTKRKIMSEIRKMFCYEHVAGATGQEAWNKALASLGKPTVSNASAAVSASRALICDDVIELVAELNEKATRKQMHSAEQVIAEIGKLAFYDLSIKEDDEKALPINAVVKTKNLELLGKRHRLFVEKVEHSGPNGEPIPISKEMTPREASEIYIDGLGQ